MLARFNLASPSPASWLPLILALIIVANPCKAQEEGADQRLPDQRTRYTGENAPAGVRLKVFLIWFALEDPDVEPHIKDKLSSGEFRIEDHERLIAYFADLRVEIESEIQRGIQRMACHDRASELSGPELRAVYNAFEDLHNGTYSKYVAIASAELASFGYVDFPEKLEKISSSFEDGVIDYRTADFLSEEILIENRVQICSHLESLDSVGS